MKWRAVVFAGLALGITGLCLTGWDWGGKPSEYPIYLEVDFGPAERPAFQDKIYIEKGTTPKEVVSQVFPVLTGKACCSFREILAIDGVKIDPARNRWWTCSVNGSKKVSPQKKKLREGDRVVWKYSEESQ